jgi:hypothetical protein
MTQRLQIPGLQVFERGWLSANNFVFHQDGKGQVVDTAMVDGAAVLMSMFWAFKTIGMFDENARGTNLLDTGAHFYDVFRCADGEYVSIGSIDIGSGQSGFDSTNCGPPAPLTKFPLNLLWNRLVSAFLSILKKFQGNIRIATAARGACPNGGFLVRSLATRARRAVGRPFARHAQGQ